MEFKDRVFLITGSTSGIGQGIAKALLEKKQRSLSIMRIMKKMQKRQTNY